MIISLPNFPYSKLREKENLKNILNNVINTEDINIFVGLLPVLSNLSCLKEEIEFYKDILETSLNRISRYIDKFYTNNDNIEEIILSLFNIIGSNSLDNSVILGILDNILYNANTNIDIKSKVYQCLYKLITSDKKYLKDLLENNITLLINMSAFITTYIGDQKIQPCLQIIKTYLSTKDMDLIVFFLNICAIEIIELIRKAYNTPNINDIMTIYLRMLRLNINPGSSSFLNDLYMDRCDNRLEYIILQCYLELVNFNLELPTEILRKIIMSLSNNASSNTVYHILMLLKKYADFNHEDESGYNNIINLYRELELDEALGRVLYKFNNNVISGEIYYLLNLL
jgi:hypothetical protein